jgi:hypothetical protein
MPDVDQEWLQRVQRPKADRWKWVRLALTVIPFTILMIFEWNRWPNGSGLLGPIGFVWYQQASGWFWAIIFAGMMLTFPWKPSPKTALLAIIGALLWVFFGVLADGIGC